MDSNFINEFFILLFSSIIYLVFYFIFCLKLKFLKSITFSFILTLVIFFILSIQYTDFNNLFLFSLFGLLNIIYVLSIIIYTPKSSIRFKILNILYDNNKGLSYKKLSNKYNDQIILKKRFERLIDSKTIVLKKNTIIISSLKGKLIIFLYMILKKIV